jgi:hypothetical protein
VSARLPDLLVIGAPKAGTTSLAAWLREHPRVAFSAQKELEYFDRNYDRGLEWYLSRLPQDPGDRVVAEATPTYLSEPGVAERVAATLPDARFVAVLRDPVARAWSNYWFFRMLGVEPRGWARAVAQSSDTPDGRDTTGYVWRGRYGEQLARWDALVGPDRLQVLLFEELIADPQAAYESVCAFAGIEPATLPDSRSVNPTTRPRYGRLQVLLRSDRGGALRRRLFLWNARGGPAPKMTPEQRAQLLPRFADDKALLERRIGRPLPRAWS